MSELLTVGAMRKLIKGLPDDRPFAVLDNFGNAVCLTVHDAHLDYPVGKTRNIVPWADYRHEVEPTSGHEVIILEPPKVEEMDD